MRILWFGELEQKPTTICLDSIDIICFIRK